LVIDKVIAKEKFVFFENEQKKSSVKGKCPCIFLAAENSASGARVGCSVRFSGYV
jgi:hypothetical protein